MDESKTISDWCDRFSVRNARFGLLLAGSLLLTACQGGIDSVFPKAEIPIPAKLIQKMKARGMTPTSPILLRIYKTENVLEVWKQKDTGRFALLETYEICKWSGKLGPKFKEGDRQAPEGFYNVGRAQLNPNSKYHLSFNIGYPNTYDRAHGRTGSHLMVHGACSSAGCYSMTDELVEEIYAMAREAIKGGQDHFQVQAFPFRMTAKNLAKHAGHKHFEFWKVLKEGSDQFELTNYPPKVDVCEKRYLFNRVSEEGKSFSSRRACPPVTMPAKLLDAWKKRLETEQAEFKKALQRHKLLGTYKDTALADADLETVSMMAKGSVPLPSPTPVEESEPQPGVKEATPEQKIAAAEDNSQAGIVSAAENEAALSGMPVSAAEADKPSTKIDSERPNADIQPVEAAEPSVVPDVREPASVDAAPGEAQPEASTSQAASNVVRAIPVPQPAPRIEESEDTARKKPWWQRTTKKNGTSFSTGEPQS